jgi:hypothetical protein
MLPETRPHLGRHQRRQYLSVPTMSPVARPNSALRQGARGALCGGRDVKTLPSSEVTAH